MFRPQLIVVSNKRSESAQLSSWKNSKDRSTLLVDWVDNELSTRKSILLERLKISHQKVSYVLINIKDDREGDENTEQVGG